MERDAVVVVGAGPTGLALACGLREAGVPARVVDAANGPAGTSRALGLQPRGVEVLDRLGALADLPERSLPINQVIVSVSGHELTRLRVGQRTRLGGPPALLLSQAEIEHALRRRLAELGGVVEWGRPVTAVDQAGIGADGGVEVRFGSGSGGAGCGGADCGGAGADDVLRAGWVVGCDGAHSAVRKAAGIGFPGVPLVERFLIADVRADLDRPRDAVSVWLRGAEMLAAFPLPGEDLWRLMTPAPASAPADGPADPDPDAVLARMRQRVANEIGREVRSAEWTSSFRIHRRLADVYRRGRVLLAGDAAHIHSPLGGQGMNTGIGDAENLAWKLALVVTGRAGDRLLDTYQAERRPVAAEVLSATSGATNLLYGDSAIARFLRDHVVVPVMDRPFVQRMIAERSSQLLVSYRGGPLGAALLGGRRLGIASSDGGLLSRNRWRLSGPQPGDRVHDLPCDLVGGSSKLTSEATSATTSGVVSEGVPAATSAATPTRLHAELRGRWAVLIPTRGTHRAPTRGTRGGVDQGGATQGRYGELARAWLGDGVTELTADVDDVWLVRPDGHLAWRGTDPAELRTWLARALDRQVPAHAPAGAEAEAEAEAGAGAGAETETRTGAG